MDPTPAAHQKGDAPKEEHKKVTIHQICGHRFLGISAAGEKVMIDGDTPPSGMLPMDLLLVALGSCTAYDVVDIMTKKRQPLTRYRVEVEGVRANTHPRRFTHIKVTHYGAGPEVTAAALNRAVELSHTKYCPVSASLNAEISVEAVVEPLEDAAG